MSIRVKNWSEFQHYKDRNPPWIKLHRKLLNDRQFFSLDGECVKTLVLLWMLAAETKNGELPAIEDIAWRFHMDSTLLASHISKLKHWLIVDDSNMLAECEQSESNLHQNRAPETETERDTERESETKTEQRAHTRSTKTENDFAVFWQYYPKKVGKQAALKAFQKARKSWMPEIGVLVASIEKQRKSDQWKRDNGQFIPNPTTWLNQGRWDDELKEGPGRKLLPQEETAQMLKEWLSEKEMEENEQQNNSLLFADDIRILPGKVEAVEDDVGSVGKAPFRHR